MFWHVEDPFASGLHTRSHLSKSRPTARHYPSVRSSRAQNQAELARKHELLRRQLYQHELDQRATRVRQEQAQLRELHREHQAAAAAAAAARQHQRRLAIFTVTAAARKIQRWWRETAAARKAMAATKVAEALSRNLAVRQARRVTQSLRRLSELEATIEGLPKPGSEQLSKRVSSKGISVFENTLERLILSADDIPTHGSDAARAIRKRLVRTANTRLQVFDDEVVAAKAAAEAERAAEQEADTDDEATAGSETGESEIGASTSPVDVVSQAAEVEWDEEGREWVASMDIKSQAFLAPPSSCPGETPLHKPSQPGPRDKLMGMPALISTSHGSTSEDDADADTGDGDGDEDLVNDLIAPQPLGSSSQLGRDFQSTGPAEIEPDSSDSDSSFVEVHRAESAAFEDEDEGFRCMYTKTSDAIQQDDGSEPAEMDLDSDHTRLMMSDAATDAGRRRRCNPAQRPGGQIR